MLKLSSVDVGGGWLIFGLPPAEVAVHPADANDRHELYLMCDDVEAFIAEMKKRNIRCSEVHDERWGLLTQVTLPGGGKLGVYEPRHARPASPARRAATRKALVKAKKGRKKKGG